MTNTAHPTKLIFACDESGGKGYSDHPESYDGETGVFVGMMLEAAYLPRIEPDFRAIYDRYVPATGKFHVADLPPDRQEALRQDVFAAVTKHQLPCFWYAVHVEGFRSWHAERLAEREEMIKMLAARGPRRIKRGAPRQNHESLHVALFGGLYANLVAFLEEKSRKQVEIEIRSDRVDEPVVAEFEEQMRMLLDDSPFVVKRTGFDTVRKKVVHGRIEISANLPPEMTVELSIEKVAIVTTYADDPFVLAADVVANSLNHRFKNRDTASKYGPLNKLTAVEGHPLERSFDAFDVWGHGDIIGDRLYRHPKAPKLNDAAD